MDWNKYGKWRHSKEIRKLKIIIRKNKLINIFKLWQHLENTKP